MTMHDYNTIVGVISLRNDKVSYPVIRQRYGIGNSGIDLIMNRYKESGLPWKDFLKLEPSQIEELIYPPKNIRKNDIPMPDFELYYERMMTKGSRVNMFYCWLDYKSEHPNGYQSSQFYEYFNRFIESFNIIVIFFIPNIHNPVFQHRFTEQYKLLLFQSNQKPIFSFLPVPPKHSHNQALQYHRF